MNPDVVAAIDDLVAKGVLEVRVAVPLRRVASGALVSVGDELRVLLWAGVFLITTGVGLLVRENLDRLGPAAIATVLGVAAVSCLIWAWRSSASRGFAFESVLLLGALLCAADLAFIEVKFTPLGSHWPWHLLILAAGYAGLAFRFESTTLFSLALSSFAAWRGVSIAGVATPWGAAVDSERLLVEALICGVLFLAVGKLLETLRYEPQFEPAAVWLGWILILGALAMRASVGTGSLAAASGLAGCGLVLAWFAWDETCLGRYALGVGAAAWGIGAACFELITRRHGDETLYPAVVVVLATAVIVIVLRAHRSMRISA